MCGTLLSIGNSLGLVGGIDSFTRCLDRGHEVGLTGLFGIEGDLEVLVVLPDLDVLESGDSSHSATHGGDTAPSRDLV